VVDMIVKDHSMQITYIIAVSLGKHNL